jgi:EAL domain-containing protein (putative c-di-GMP-specific phosphodiesterase class I)
MLDESHDGPRRRHHLTETAMIEGSSGSMTPHAAQPTQARGRVLVVDDDPALARMYARALSAGHEITIAMDGACAAELLARQGFDVIVSDVVMPGMDGLELLRHARQRDADVSVLLLSGTATDGDAARAAGSGALLYLAKPVDLGSLRQAVDYALQVRRAAKPRAPREPALAARFERAMGSLYVVHQPIVQATSRAVFGYEALVRSEEPAMCMPDAIIQAAEQLVRAKDLGRAVRARVADAARVAPARATIFVNLHASDLADDELFSPTAPLSRIASRVVLEITERASLDELGDVAPRLAQLRGLGFRIAIDDLGAGYAGLSAFALFKPEVVKLDRSLVQAIDADPFKRRLVEVLPALCRKLGVMIIAEGVETAAERDTLATLGCELMQGYLFARPAKGFPRLPWERPVARQRPRCPALPPVLA